MPSRPIPAPTDDPPTTAPERPRSRLFAAARRSLGLSIATGSARALLGVGAVLTVGRIIDAAVDGAALGSDLAWLGGLLLARSLLSAPLPLAAVDTSLRVEEDLRARLLRHVLSLGPRPDRRTGRLVSEVTDGVEAVGTLAGTFLPQLVAGMSTPLLLALVVAMLDVPTAAVLLLVLPAVPLLLRLLEKRFASVSARYRETADELAVRFLDGLQGLVTLETLDQAEFYGDAIAEDAARLRRETMALLRVNQLALLAVDTLFTLGTVVTTAGMAAVRLSVGAVTVGQAVAIVLIGVMLIEPLTQIGRFFYVGAIGRAAAEQMKQLLGTQGELRASVAGSVMIGTVELRGVTYTYPDGTRAVTGISFHIEAGERVALVGASGAGKTTVAHLVLGLIQPQSGEVRVGGRAVLVPQRPYLFHGSVAENLRIAKPDAGDDELWKALEAADLAEMVRAKPEKLDAPVGERGLKLSGGEAQRLAIARALLVDAPVVVLDEPTSNIDLESEARVKEALHRLTEGRTVVVIAHRRSTLSGVDRILVIDEGRLVRSAPPQEINEVMGVEGL
ncbi:MAG: ABC transporter ATP-binding protein/permease [Acidimicrobiia bacterium]